MLQIPHRLCRSSPPPPQSLHHLGLLRSSSTAAANAAPENPPHLKNASEPPAWWSKTCLCSTLVVRVPTCRLARHTFGGGGTICKSWKCAPPEDAAPQACFRPFGKVINDTAISPHCRSCYSDRLSFLRMPLPSPNIDGTTLGDNDIVGDDALGDQASQSSSSETCPEGESSVEDDNGLEGKFSAISVPASSSGAS